MSATVLIVEDEFNIGKLVRTYLERDGYEVVWVRSGEDGLVELERHDIDLIVLDVGLPGHRRLRSLPPRARRVGRAGHHADRSRRGDRPRRRARARRRRLRAQAIQSARARRPGQGGAAAHAAVQAGRRRVSSCGSVELRRDAREATRAGVALDLTMKEFDLLACFLENAGPGAHPRAAPRAGLGPRVSGRHAHRRPARRPVARQARRRRHDRDAARHRLQAGAAVSAGTTTSASTGRRCARARSSSSRSAVVIPALCLVGLRRVGLLPQLADRRRAAQRSGFGRAYELSVEVDEPVQDTGAPDAGTARCADARDREPVRTT